MKGLGSKVTRALQLGSRLTCNDNSGAKIVEIIGIKGAKAKYGMAQKAGVGNIVIISVKKGNTKTKGKILKAVIIRQKKMYRRPSGIRVCFEDNAAVIVDENGIPAGSEIKGAVAREVADRFPKVAAISPAVL